MSHYLLSPSPGPPQLETLSIQFFANQGSFIGQRKAPELNSNQLRTPWGSELILVFFCFSKSLKSTLFLGTYFSLLQHKSVISLVPSRDFWLHSKWENVLLSSVNQGRRKWLLARLTTSISLGSSMGWQVTLLNFCWRFVRFKQIFKELYSSGTAWHIVIYATGVLQMFIKDTDLNWLPSLTLITHVFYWFQFVIFSFCSYDDLNQ